MFSTGTLKIPVIYSVKDAIAVQNLIFVDGMNDINLIILFCSFEKSTRLRTENNSS